MIPILFFELVAESKSGIWGKIRYKALRNRNHSFMFYFTKERELVLELLWPEKQKADGQNINEESWQWCVIGPDVPERPISVSNVLHSTPIHLQRFSKH